MSRTPAHWTKTRRPILRRWWVRLPLWALGLAGGIFGIAYGIGAWKFSVPRYRGPVSDHFDGKRFYNQAAIEDHGFGDFLRWITNRDRGPWRDWVDAAPGLPPQRRVDGGELVATFINHSTVLLQIDGVNILTDPVYSSTVGPANLVGVSRHRPPGIRFEDLPPIDIVLISHNHYDHLDLPTLARLAEEHAPTIYLPLGNAALLEREGIAGGVDLDWWESATEGDVRIHCVPAQHFSGRGPDDRNAALWGGFVVEAPSGRMYFAGDTGWGPHFRQIFERFAPLRLAMLPIGAYRPRWFMAPVHIDPQDALRAHKLLRPEASLAIHYGTFAQADDGEFEPMRLLDSLLNREPRSLPPFYMLDNGESLTLDDSVGSR